MSETSERRRRTGEQARHRILEAAQKRLTEVGPEGLRLQELAADLGISHPAILHHFGSREGLLTALASHGVEALNRELAERIQAGAVDLSEILALTTETLASRGHARLLAWLALSGRTPGPGEPRRLAELAQLALASRNSGRAAEGRELASYEDTAHAIVLVALVLFGDALLGDLVRGSAGLDPTTGGARFRAWLADVLAAHFSSSEDASK